mgnify:CR=1 FL=1
MNNLDYKQNIDMDNKIIETKIIAMERAALEEWNNGNPSGYLEIYAEDITYFDPFQNLRIDGWDKMKAFYETLRGKGHVERYNMINPVVQVWDKTAILTYNLDSYSDGKLYQWNCTEVYRQKADGNWEIAHNHWSLVRPMDTKQ